jgi:hypothetical protein
MSLLIPVVAITSRKTDGRSVVETGPKNEFPAQKHSLLLHHGEDVKMLQNVSLSLSFFAPCLELFILHRLCLRFEGFHPKIHLSFGRLYNSLSPS